MILGIINNNYTFCWKTWKNSFSITISRNKHYSLFCDNLYYLKHQQSPPCHVRSCWPLYCWSSFLDTFNKLSSSPQVFLKDTDRLCIFLFCSLQAKTKLFSAQCYVVLSSCESRIGNASVIFMWKSRFQICCHIKINHMAERIYWNHLIWF